ncbi:MAG: hypothetical protein ACJ71B_05590, partial [Nitrososphaera sp.]
AIEGFTSHKFCELILKDRKRSSKENALTICDYIIAMKRELPKAHLQKIYYTGFIGVSKSCWDRKEVH